MSAFTTFGPGTVTLGSDYSGEVLSFTVNHAYAEVGSTRTMLNGDIRRAKKRRDPDSVTLTFEPDFTTAGLYSMLQTSDLDGGNPHLRAEHGGRGHVVRAGGAVPAGVGGGRRVRCPDHVQR